MNKTHGSRKQDIEMHIKMQIMLGNIRRAIEICQKYSISSKRFGELCKEIDILRG